MIKTSVRRANGELPTAIQYMPPGTSVINAWCEGKPVRRVIRVDASTATRLQADLEAKQAAAEAGEAPRPCGFFDHEKKAASFIPQRFRWDDAQGVVLDVEWTNAGRTAVAGRDYSYFSPRFAADPEDGLVLGLTDNVEVGSLVNNPAFRTIERIAASCSDCGVLDPRRSVEFAPEGRYSAGTMDELIALLGLGPDATPEDVVAAVKKLQDGQSGGDEPKPAPDVDPELEAAKAELKKRDEELAAANAELAEMRKANEEAFMVDIIEAGHCGPHDEARKESIRKLYRSHPAEARSIFCTKQEAQKAGEQITASHSGAPSGDFDVAASYDADIAKL